MALKDWGGADLEDVACAAQYLKSLAYVDAQRIGVFGGSYGGYMTFMAVTKKPDIWRRELPGLALPTCTRCTRSPWSTSSISCVSKWATRCRMPTCGATAVQSTLLTTCAPSC